MQPIKSYFEEALKAGASDLHLVGGDKPTIRIDGNLKDLETEPIFAEELEKAIYTILDASKKKTFEETLELDFGLIEVEMHGKVLAQLTYHPEM